MVFLSNGLETKLKFSIHWTNFSNEYNFLNMKKRNKLGIVEYPRPSELSK